MRPSFVVVPSILQFLSGWGLETPTPSIWMRGSDANTYSKNSTDTYLFSVEKIRTVPIIYNFYYNHNFEHSWTIKITSYYARLIRSKMTDSKILAPPDASCDLGSLDSRYYAHQTRSTRHTDSALSTSVRMSVNSQQLGTVSKSIAISTVFQKGASQIMYLTAITLISPNAAIILPFCPWKNRTTSVRNIRANFLLRHHGFYECFSANSHSPIKAVLSQRRTRVLNTIKWTKVSPKNGTCLKKADFILHLCLALVWKNVLN